MSDRLDRQTRQREEWIRNLQLYLTPAVEQTMRKLWTAAELCAHMQPGVLTADDAYSQLLARSRTWSDQEIRDEIGGEKKAEDADLSLQMVVKSHATVLALSSARKCREVISVPTVIKFYRGVIEACASELTLPSFFVTQDIDMRTKVRGWIDRIISNHALNIVPVGLFAKSEERQSAPRLRSLQRAIERVELDPEVGVISDDVNDNEAVVVPQPVEVAPVPVPVPVAAPAAPIPEPERPVEMQSAEEEKPTEPEPQEEAEEDEPLSVTLPGPGAKGEEMVEEEEEETV